MCTMGAGTSCPRFDVVLTGTRYGKCRRSTLFVWAATRLIIAGNVTILHVEIATRIVRLPQSNCIEQNKDCDK